MDRRSYPLAEPFQDVTAPTLNKARRLVDDDRVVFIGHFGKNLVYQVLGDSMNVYNVVLYVVGDLITGDCPCPHYGTCSHIVAAMVSEFGSGGKEQG
jgi:uncharacterized Zn finger protein